MEQARLPRIVQGGMGAGVSGWRLARAVSTAGQLGVVAGTALDLILVRRLQQGDEGGDLRRALARFPVPRVADWILDRYWIPGGKDRASRYRSKPMPDAQPSRRSEELLVAANFVEVSLAKEGHGGLVGVNYLEKIQLPTLPSLFGAMLAGVDWVLMGAGIPVAIPGALDRLAEGRGTELALDVSDTSHGQRFVTRFDPARLFDGPVPRLARPRFAAIVSSTTVAAAVLRRSGGEVDALVVENHTAGGHNAPPRGRPGLTPTGEPAYGPRDRPEAAAFSALGKPFWLAGSQGRPGCLAAALDRGAAGIQVGTAFAYCEESDLRSDLKRSVLARSRHGEVSTFTDPVASPTGFPFKVVGLPGTLSDERVFRARTRRCDLGYLRHGYRREDGTLGWRCPAEATDEFISKGGRLEDAAGRKCVCNALMANIGLGQVLRDGDTEHPLLTSGDDVRTVASFLRPGASTYRAVDVIERLLEGEVSRR